MFISLGELSVEGVSSPTVLSLGELLIDTKKYSDVRYRAYFARSIFVCRKLSSESMREHCNGSRSDGLRQRLGGS